MKKQLLTMTALIATAGIFASSYSKAQKQARSEEKAKKYEIAAASWDKAAEAADKPGTKCDAYFRAGECMRLKQDYAKASEYFQKILEVKDAPVQQKGNAYLRIGQCLVFQKKYDEALKHCETALHDSEIPSFCKAQIFTLNGDVLKRQRKFADAVEVFKKILDIPELQANLKGSAFWQIGYCLRALKKYEESNEALTQCLALNNNYYYAQLYIGLNYIALNKYADAVKAFEKIKTFKNVHPRLLAQAELYAGNCYFKMNDYDKAKAAYEQVVANEKASKGDMKAAKKILEKIAAENKK